MRKETERGGNFYQKKRTIDQSESSETDLSLNIYAATRKMVNYARVG
jgi:hypothetical protein